MKKSIKKILSALVASAMVVAAVPAVSYADKPTDWAMGVEDKDAAIVQYTVAQAVNAEFQVPVMIFNNTNTNNYTVYVEYDPSEVIITGAEAGDFSMSAEDLLSKSINYVPAAGNPSFPSADGVSTEAELGRVKFAFSADVAGVDNLTAEEATAFTLNFQVTKEIPVVGDQYWINFIADDGANVLYGDDAASGVDATAATASVSDGYVLIVSSSTDNGSSSSSGGGGGGGSSVKTTTTTEATTESVDTGDSDTEGTTSTGTGSSVSLNKDDHYAYVVGYPDGNVHPNGQITRAEVASIFFRLLTDEVRDSYFTQENDFSDVSLGNWFHNAVSTMANADVVAGYTDGTFKPNQPITRAEFATIAAQFDSNTYSGDDKFNDISGHWAANYINAAAERGWISGYTDGSFKPNQNITRAEAMTLINSMLERNVDVDGLLDDMVKWPDNSNVDAWYYTNVQEATNSHYYDKDAEGVEDWSELREVRDWAALERSYAARQ